MTTRLKIADYCLKASKSSLGRPICTLLPAFSDSLEEFFSGLRKYEQLRDEVSSLNIYLSENNGGKVTIVFDAKCGPNSYGDFSKYLLLAKVLQSRFLVKFVIVADELGRFWRNMTPEEIQVLTHQYVLLASGIVHNPEVNVVLANSFKEIDFDEKFNFVIFRKKTLDRKLDFWNLQWLLILLYQKEWFGNELLLDKNDFTPPKVSPANPYVVWQIRYGSESATHKNETTESLVECYKQLRNILGNNIEIIVCSSSAGLSEILKIAANHKFKLTSARKYSQDFSGDIGLAFHAKLFVQLGNGGMGEYFLLGSNKFLFAGANFDQQRPVLRTLLSTKKTPYMYYPWLRESQFLASDVYSPKLTFITPIYWKKISSNLKSRGLVEKESSSGVSS